MNRFILTVGSVGIALVVLGSLMLVVRAQTPMFNITQDVACDGDYLVERINVTVYGESYPENEHHFYCEDGCDPIEKRCNPNERGQLFIIGGVFFVLLMAVGYVWKRY
jgi:hypothetical protein